MNRLDLSNYKKIVLKVGSALVAPDGKSCSVEYCLPIAHFIKKCRKQGIELVLVSSGAVAAGYNKLKPDNHALSIKEKQALAAVGQSIVINHWQRFFDSSVAQVLLTHDDLAQNNRFTNAKNTIKMLHSLAVLPIVNENDTVAIEELKVGDNDNLAAEVAVLIDADLLIIFSDINGLYDDNPNTNPNASLIKEVKQLDANIQSMAKDSDNPQATGGMKTKLQAALTATNKAIDTIICNGKNESYMKLFDGENPGTWIVSSKSI